MATGSNDHKSNNLTCGYCLQLDLVLLPCLVLLLGQHDQIIWALSENSLYNSTCTANTAGLQSLIQSSLWF